MLNEAMLRTYISALVVEAKVDDLKKLNPSLASSIDELNRAIRPKYLDWAVKQLSVGNNVFFPALLRHCKSTRQRFVQNELMCYATRVAL